MSVSRSRVSIETSLTMYTGPVFVLWGLIIAVCGHNHQELEGTADGEVDVSIPPVVSSSSGSLLGAWMRTRRGRPLRAFRGVRYAEPPIAERRFQPPVPITEYSGQVDATKDGPACPQPTYGDYYVDEDCLRLNVYTPGRVSKPLPVVVFIHAGGFYSVSGRSDVAGPEYLLDRDLVLVTINYRLGSLGFLSTGDALAPGNNGFKDQVAALRWVRRNVAAFGGDPDLVTISGYSAGAFSVMLHTVSPMSKGLFHRAVSMSGSPISQVELPAHQRHLAERQARLLSCPTADSADMLTCLGTKSAKELGDSLNNMSNWNFNSKLKKLATPQLISSPVEPRGGTSTCSRTSRNSPPYSCNTSPFPCNTSRCPCGYPGCQCNTNICPCNTSPCPCGYDACPCNSNICPCNTSRCPCGYPGCPCNTNICPCDRSPCPCNSYNCPCNSNICPCNTSRCPCGNSDNCPCNSNICPCNTSRCPCGNSDNCPCNTNICPCNTSPCPCNSYNCPCNTNICPCNTSKCPCGYSGCPCNTNICPCNTSPCPCNSYNCPCNTNICPCNTSRCPCNTPGCPCNTNVCPMTNPACHYSAIRSLSAILNDTPAVSLPLEFGIDPILLWVPVIEPDFGQERFLTVHPLEALRRGMMHAVPYIVSQTQDEFFWLAFSVLSNDSLTSTMDREWRHVAPISFQLPPQSDAAADRLRQFYLEDRPLKNDTFTARQLGKLYNDAVIGFGAHSLANALAVYSPQDTFYYEFGYIGNHSHYEDPETKKPVGAAHHDDLIYLFSINASFPMIPPDDSQDSKMVDKMTAIFYNFARYGDPNPRTDSDAHSVHWPRMRKDTRRYLRVDQPCTVGDKLFEDRFHVWETLFRDAACDICTQ